MQKDPQPSPLNKKTEQLSLNLLRIKLQSIEVKLRFPQFNQKQQIYQYKQLSDNKIIQWLKKKNNDLGNEQLKKIQQYFQRFMIKEEQMEKQSQIKQNNIKQKSPKKSKNIKEDHLMKTQSVGMNNEKKIDNFGMSSLTLNQNKKKQKECKLQLKCSQKSLNRNSPLMKKQQLSQKQKQSSKINNTKIDSIRLSNPAKVNNTNKDHQLKFVYSLFKQLPKFQINKDTQRYEHNYKRNNWQLDSYAKKIKFNSFKLFDDKMKLGQIFMFTVNKMTEFEINISDSLQITDEYFAKFPLKQFTQINHVNHKVNLKMMKKINQQNLEIKALINDKKIPRIEAIVKMTIYSTNIDYWGIFRIKKVQIKISKSNNSEKKNGQSSQKHLLDKKNINLSFSLPPLPSLSQNQPCANPTQILLPARAFKQRQQIIWTQRINFKVSTWTRSLKISFNEFPNDSNLIKQYDQLDLFQNQMLKQQDKDKFKEIIMNLKGQYRVKVKIWYRFQMANSHKCREIEDYQLYMEKNQQREKK